MTDGNAFVNNYSVIKQLTQVHQNLGFVSQRENRMFNVRVLLLLIGAGIAHNSMRWIRC